MKNLVLGSLIAIAASQAAGCIITSGDDGGANAYITANWQIKHQASNTVITCPPTFDTAALYNQPVDAAGNNVGAVVVDLFDCAASTGTSAPLVPGLYLSWIEIANHDNTQVYAKSLSANVDITVQDKSFSAQILDDGGYFQLAWTLKGESTNAPLSCAQAGAAGGVEAIGTDIANASNSASDQFDCEAHYGVTAGYVQGTYTVSVNALNAADVPISPSQNLTNKIIQPKNMVTNLGTIEIPITGL
ncbi:MAG TPA: hypothetical protein VLB44_19900 [Kofleriaceae bacterium]|nr:hypothetical protein [Kofleriaceae bacterium]